MPTLLDDRIFESIEEPIDVPEFDLERLARISAAGPDIEPPPAPRHRFRRTLVMALLATMIVGGLATLRPATGYASPAGATCAIR